MQARKERMDSTLEFLKEYQGEWNATTVKRRTGGGGGALLHESQNRTTILRSGGRKKQVDSNGDAANDLELKPMLIQTLQTRKRQPLGGGGANSLDWTSFHHLPPNHLELRTNQDILNRVQELISLEEQFYAVPQQRRVMGGSSLYHPPVEEKKVEFQDGWKEEEGIDGEEEEEDNATRLRVRNRALVESGRETMESFRHCI